MMFVDFSKDFNISTSHLCECGDDDYAYGEDDEHPRSDS